jgi:hypothetical protein
MELAKAISSSNVRAAPLAPAAIKKVRLLDDSAYTYYAERAHFVTQFGMELPGQDLMNTRLVCCIALSNIAVGPTGSRATSMPRIVKGLGRGYGSEIDLAPYSLSTH